MSNDYEKKFLMHLTTFTENIKIGFDGANLYINNIKADRSTVDEILKITKRLPKHIRHALNNVKRTGMTSRTDRSVLRHNCYFICYSWVQRPKLLDFSSLRKYVRVREFIIRSIFTYITKYNIFNAAYVSCGFHIFRKTASGNYEHIAVIDKNKTCVVDFVLNDYVKNYCRKFVMMMYRRNNKLFKLIGKNCCRLICDYF